MFCAYIRNTSYRRIGAEVGRDAMRTHERCRIEALGRMAGLRAADSP